MLSKREVRDERLLPELEVGDDVLPKGEVGDESWVLQQGDVGDESWVLSEGDVRDKSGCDQRVQ